MISGLGIDLSALLGELSAGTGQGGAKPDAEGEGFEAAMAAAAAVHVAPVVPQVPQQAPQAQPQAPTRPVAVGTETEAAPLEVVAPAASPLTRPVLDERPSIPRFEAPGRQERHGVEAAFEAWRAVTTLAVPPSKTGSESVSVPVPETESVSVPVPESVSVSVRVSESVSVSRPTAPSDSIALAESAPVSVSIAESAAPSRPESTPKAAPVPNPAPNPISIATPVPAPIARPMAAPAPAQAPAPAAIPTPAPLPAYEAAPADDEEPLDLGAEPSPRAPVDAAAPRAFVAPPRDEAAPAPARAQAAPDPDAPPSEAPAPAHARLVVGEGADRLALSISAHDGTVSIRAHATQPELASAFVAGAAELRDSLRRQGLELGDVSARGQTGAAGDPQTHDSAHRSPHDAERRERPYRERAPLPEPAPAPRRNHVRVV
jgi:hypothetical protein